MRFEQSAIPLHNKPKFSTLHYGMKTYILALGMGFGLLFRVELTAQQLTFRCTQVDTAGNITLFWSSSGLPANYQYLIFGDTSKSGTYDLLGTTIDTFFTHTGADGGAKQWFYVIKAVPISQQGPEYLSDTIGSICLRLGGLGEGVAKLYWTRPTVPPLASQSKEFTIYRQRQGTWTMHAKTDTTVFFDTLHVCDEILDYEVRLYDSIGNCESISNIQSGSFRDKTLPSEPQLDSVSINPITGLTELGWNRSPDTDVFGYIVYIFKKGKWEIVDTVFGAETTYFVDTKHDANDSIREYRIAAIDTCRNASKIGEKQNTLLINELVNMCDSTITLQWNAYCGMLDSITGYQIWVSINGGVFVQISNVPDNQRTYTHRGVATGKYVYFVRAYNSKNGYSGTSARKEVDFTYKNGSGNVWLRYVSVVDNQDIKVVVFVEDTVNYQNLFLYKSDNNKATFTHIDTKSKTSKEDFFIDKDVDVQTLTYFYLVAITDEECNNIFAYSDTANNVVLQAKASQQGDEIAITWQPYYGFSNRLDSYDILRRTQTESTFQFSGNVPAAQLDYAENVWGAASGGGKFYYQVSANEDNTNKFGFQDKSYSNIVEISKEAITYIPNMFFPASQIEANRVFKPVNSYVDADEYVFSIYDRWGSIIFSTNDINAGWDGTVNGKPAAAGVYVYTLTYRLDKKNFYKTHGRVTLVR